MVPSFIRYDEPRVVLVFAVLWDENTHHGTYIVVYAWQMVCMIRKKLLQINDDGKTKLGTIFYDFIYRLQK